MPPLFLWIELFTHFFKLITFISIFVGPELKLCWSSERKKTRELKCVQKTFELLSRSKLPGTEQPSGNCFVSVHSPPPKNIAE